MGKIDEQPWGTSASVSTTALSDVAVLRDQRSMFAAVGSDATMWRMFAQIGPIELRGIASARAAARSHAWAAGAGPAGDALVIDMDATIIGTTADKQDARPTYKRTYGHHPRLAMVAETGEVLAGKLRPGNAGANCAEDHVTVLADAIAQLPAPWRAGHGRYDDESLVEHRIVVRADSAGASHWLTEELPRPQPRLLDRTPDRRPGPRHPPLCSR